MSEEKKDQNEKHENRVEEPATAFKTVHVFSSFEEAAEFEAKARADLSHDKRLKHVEELRRRVFGKYLLPDGTWPPVSKTFRIMKPYTDDTGE